MNDEDGILEFLMVMAGLAFVIYLVYHNWNLVWNETMKWVAIGLYITAIVSAIFISYQFYFRYEWATRAMTFSLGYSVFCLIGSLGESVFRGYLIIDTFGLFIGVIFIFGISHFVKFFYLMVRSLRAEPS
jgi:hypothetical protein